MLPALDLLGHSFGAEDDAADVGGELAEGLFVAVVGLVLRDEDHVRLREVAEGLDACWGRVLLDAELLGEDCCGAAEPGVDEDGEGAGEEFGGLDVGGGDGWGEGEKEGGVIVKSFDREGHGGCYFDSVSVLPSEMTAVKTSNSR